MTTTPIIDRPTEIHIDKVWAEFGEKQTVHLFPADDNLTIDGLRGMQMDIDEESIPVLVGVHWQGDHDACTGVHLPNLLTVQHDGSEGHDYFYDRLAVIDAAILGLQRAKAVMERATGRES